MNVLTTTWRQLVRRRLWPVALLLVAALAAVPVLLSRDAAPIVPESEAAPAQTAKADDSLATPVVAKAAEGDRSRRRRVLGSRKDPFTPAPVKKPKAPKKKPAAANQQSGSGKGTGGSSAPPSLVVIPPTITPPTVVTTPKPKKPSYPKGSLLVRFGDATADSLPRLLVRKLDPLPDDETPVLVYMGLTDNGKKAVFLVDESLEATGDGECRPHPASCEKIVLAKGETEFFDLVDPESGDVTAQFELDLLAIN